MEQKRVNRKEIYTKTDEFLKEYFSSLLIIIILFSIANELLSLVLSLGIEGLSNLIAALSKGDIQSMQVIYLGASSSTVVAVCFALVAELVDVGIFIAILNAYRYGGKISFETVINTFKANYSKYLVAALAITVISLLISLIPNVGGILNRIIRYGVAFSYFLIMDEKTENGLSSLKDSYELASGHLWNLFVMDMNYSLRILVFTILIVIFTSLFVTPFNPMLGLIIDIAGLAVFVLKYLPAILTAKTIYYDEIQAIEEENV